VAKRLQSSGNSQTTQGYRVSVCPITGQLTDKHYTNSWQHVRSFWKSLLNIPARLGTAILAHKMLFTCSEGRVAPPSFRHGERWIDSFGWLSN
jgi:hypothetical protein